MTTDCEQFTGHERAICEGNLDLSLEKINRYRQHWGIAPLEAKPERPEYLGVAIRTERANQPTRNASGRKPRVAAEGKATRKSRVSSGRNGGSGGCGCGGGKKRPLKPNAYGPGSKLLAIFEAAGVPHCDECLDLAGKMDRWGKRGCAQRVSQIVGDILPRARQWMADNKPWAHGLLGLVGAEDAVLRLAIRRKVQQAIDQAEDRRPRAARKVEKRRPRAAPRTAWQPTGNWRAAFKPGPGLPEYITAAQLAADTLSLVPRLPPDITAVAGVARSGLHPATLLAMTLHVPLLVIRQRQNDWVSASNGWRLDEGAPKSVGKILVVDDTTMTGNSLRRNKQTLEKMPGEKLFAAVYVNPAAVAKPDLWVRDLPWPHLLEWNLFNSVLLDSFALDFDGILCEECPAADDDDGPRYERFLAEARPLHLVRKRPVKLVVTARLEKYRAQTLAWLARWKIRVSRLVMGPWATKAERARHDVAAFKASEFERFLTGAGGIKPRMFIESDPRQAERIAQLASGLVVCPAARRCYKG
jgi:adenine/guanine phosphoribosyltransferase-like PRPP-binding protein